jgi:hypothetical protein
VVCPVQNLKQENEAVPSESLLPVTMWVRRKQNTGGAPCTTGPAMGVFKIVKTNKVVRTMVKRRAEKLVDMRFSFAWVKRGWNAVSQLTPETEFDSQGLFVPFKGLIR